MKKVNLLTALMIFFLISAGLNAQPKTGIDFFAGKWNVLVKDTPSGDKKMVVNFEKTDNKTIAAIQDSTGAEMYPVTNIEVKENEAIVIFTSSGYDISLNLVKKDEDHLAGTAFGMFEVEGVRIKAKK